MDVEMALGAILVSGVVEEKSPDYLQMMGSMYKTTPVADERISRNLVRKK